MRRVTYKVSEPETDKALRIRSSDREEATDVDAPVEDQQVSLDGSLRVEDVSLASG